jgi:hypothetical protein
MPESTPEDKRRVWETIITVAYEMGYKAGRGANRALARELMRLKKKGLTGPVKWQADRGDPTQLEKTLDAIGLDLEKTDIEAEYKKLQRGTAKPVPEQPQEVIPDVPQDNFTCIPQANTADLLDESPDVPQHSTLSQLGQDMVDTLVEVAHWWKTKGSVETQVDDDTAPKFKLMETAKTYSVRLPERLVNAVNARLAKEGAKHGGTFSRLVMWLLWRYVGCPAEYIKTSDQGSTEKAGAS